MADDPTVSIIVRTRNEERYLGALLERIRRQNLQPVEVLVVDSGSTDRTLEIAQTGADRVVHIPASEFTFGRSLNYGCREARGEILALVSAHTLPVSNNWLANLVAPFADRAIAMVYGRQVPHDDTRIGEARDFAETYGVHSTVHLDEPLGNNANSAIRRSLWEEHEFDEDLTGLEDVEWAHWAQRRGYSIAYAANAAIVHIHDESASQVYRRFHREGEAWAAMFHHKPLHPVTATIKGVADTLHDLRFAWSIRAPAREYPRAVAFRAAAAIGFHRGGVNQGRGRVRRAKLVAQAPPVAERAVVIAGPDNHSLSERAAPQAGKGDAVVRVAYVGVCATDVEIAEGRQVYYRNGRGAFPIVPGHEWSGVVEHVGDEVDLDWVGRRVVGECLIGCGVCEACKAGYPAGCERRTETGVLDRDGAYATRLVVPVRALHQLPDRLPLREASLAEPVAVVLKALRRSERDLDGTVALVVGAGPIGHITAQVLFARGADVTVVDPDEARLRLLADLDFSTSAELDDALLERSELIIEATGRPDVAEALAARRPQKSRLVLLGVPGSEGDVTAPDGSVTTLGSDTRDWPAAIELLTSGRANLGALLEHVAPLDDYADAWDDVRARSRLKTILSVGSELSAA